MLVFITTGTAFCGVAEAPFAGLPKVELNFDIGGQSPTWTLASQDATNAYYTWQGYNLHLWLEPKGQQSLVHFSLTPPSGSLSVNSYSATITRPSTGLHAVMVPNQRRIAQGMDVNTAPENVVLYQCLIPAGFQETCGANVDAPFILVTNSRGDNALSAGWANANVGGLNRGAASGTDYVLTLIRQNDTPLTGSKLEDELIVCTAARPWFDAVRDYAKTFDSYNGRVHSVAPEWTSEPVFCTWYCYLDNINQSQVLSIAQKCKDIGIGTILIDAGWDCNPNGGYANFNTGILGDFTAIPSRFPDLPGAIAQIHAMGLRVELWSAPFWQGKNSQAYQQCSSWHLWNAGVENYSLCPRYVGTKQYLRDKFAWIAQTYGIDGMWLDSADSIPGTCTANHQHVSKSMGDSFIDCMQGIRDGLRSVKSDAITEARVMHGNMNSKVALDIVQPSDAPKTYEILRLANIHIRAWSYDIVCKNDPMIWPKNSTAATIGKFLAANVCSGVPDLSVDFLTAPQSECDITAAWLNFYKLHKNTLLKGDFKLFGQNYFSPDVTITGTDEAVIYLKNPSTSEAILPTNLTKIILLNCTSSNTVKLRFSAATGRYSAQSYNPDWTVSGSPVIMDVAGCANLSQNVPQGGAAIVSLITGTPTSPEPGAPVVTSPINGSTSNKDSVSIGWSGPAHTKYRVRVNTVDNPDAGIAWDSGEVTSAVNSVTTGVLPDMTTYYVYISLGNATGWSAWSTAGYSFKVDKSYVPPTTSTVYLSNRSLTDNDGPFLGLGVTYMQALRRCKYDLARLNSDLAFLSSRGFNYIRVLSMVGWNSYWDGDEIAPISFTNDSGKPVAAWTDYWQQLRDLIDIAYDQHGLRTQITIFADAQLMPNKADRIAHMQTLLDNLAGRENKVILLEVANEGWQNGFPDAQGIADLREFGQYLSDRTQILIALSASQGQTNASLTQLYSGSAADIATEHFSRNIATSEGGWLPVRDCWRVASATGVPPCSSNEPIGPGSSVNSENDPIKLVSAAAFAWTSGLPMYVYHTSAGVKGLETFESMPGVSSFTHLAQILPSDLAGWTRNDGVESSAPFTALCAGQANKYWTDVSGATDGCHRNIGASNGSDFVCYPQGILSGGLTLEARRKVTFKVYNPLTGAVVMPTTTKTPGQRFTLAQGSGAYIIKSVALAPSPVTDLAATPGNGKVAISWISPLDTSFTGVLIRYKTGGYPTGPTDGSLLIDKNCTPGSVASCSHTGATNGTRYFYCAYSRNGEPNYSRPATTTAVPGSATATSIPGSSAFNSGSDGWNITVWKSGDYAMGAMAWNASAGRSGGGLRCMGSGATDNDNRCTREGGDIWKVISTSGYANIQVSYDLKVNSLNANVTGYGSGGCAPDADAVDEQFTVFYSMDSGANWTQADWLKRASLLGSYQTYGTRSLDLSTIPEATNNPQFALRFRWQLNTDSDTADLDNITVTGNAIIPTVSIADAKNLGDGQVRSIKGGVVTAAFSDRFYIQQPGVYSGIQVRPLSTVLVGDEIDVSGAIRGANAERYIDSSGIPILRYTPGPGDPGPVAMGVPALGGIRLNSITPGVMDGNGPYNIGLLVTACGKITQRDLHAQFFYIDDGSSLMDGTQTEVTPGTFEDSVGFRVVASPAGLNAGDYVVATGISSFFPDSGVMKRQVLVRAGGIQKLWP